MSKRERARGNVFSYKVDLNDSVVRGTGSESTSLRASCTKCTSDARGPSVASGGMAGAQATRREGWAGPCSHLLLACLLAGPARVASRASHTLCASPRVCACVRVCAHACACMRVRALALNNARREKEERRVTSVAMRDKREDASTREERREKTRVTREKSERLGPLSSTRST